MSSILVSRERPPVQVKAVEDAMGCWSGLAQCADQSGPVDFANTAVGPTRFVSLDIVIRGPSSSPAFVFTHDTGIGPVCLVYLSGPNGSSCQIESGAHPSAEVVYIQHTPITSPVFFLIQIDSSSSSCCLAFFNLKGPVVVPGSIGIL